MIHNLKTWPEYFVDVCKGIKTFEVRKNDRNFNFDDILNLQEYDPNLKDYTGRSVYCEIKYMLKGREEFGMNSDTVIMGIKTLSNKEFVERFGFQK